MSQDSATAGGESLSVTFKVVVAGKPLPDGKIPQAAGLGLVDLLNQLLPGAKENVANAEISDDAGDGVSKQRLLADILGQQLHVLLPGVDKAIEFASGGQKTSIEAPEGQELLFDLIVSQG